MATKTDKASALRLLLLRPKWIQKMLKDDGRIRIGPIFPEVDRTETDVSDRPRVVLYRTLRQRRKRAAGKSRSYNAAHS